MQYAKQIDNFLPEEEFITFRNILNSNIFPWYYNEHVCYVGDGVEQFTHVFFDEKNRNVNSAFYSYIECFLEKLNIKKLVRIKANLNLKTVSPIKTGYHIDHPDVTTAVFYLDSNNGGTEFAENTFVKSVSNRMVIFDSNIKHSGVTCTDERKRIVLNFNYLI